jgi:hypothetical protein
MTLPVCSCCPDSPVAASEVLDGEWHLQVETRREPTGCPTCGAVARVKDRRTVTVRDLPASGVPVVVRWCKRVSLPLGLDPAKERRPYRVWWTGRWLARVWDLRRMSGFDTSPIHR